MTTKMSMKDLSGRICNQLASRIWIGTSGLLINDLQEIFTYPGHWSMVMDSWGTVHKGGRILPGVDSRSHFHSAPDAPGNDANYLEITEKLSTVQNFTVLNKKRIFYKKKREKYNRHFSVTHDKDVTKWSCDQKILLLTNQVVTDNQLNDHMTQLNDHLPC
jgi:hypothetical protein